MSAGPSDSELRPRRAVTVSLASDVLADDSAGSASRVPGLTPRKSAPSDSRPQALSLTPLKEELTARIPVSRDAAAFREARRILREELGGSQALREELMTGGWVDRQTSQLTTGLRPFNIFARCACGEQKQPDMEEEQAAVPHEYRSRFQVCKNRAENDEHWADEDPEWVGKASMARRHRFLTTKDLAWHWFNVLSFGFAEDNFSASSLASASAAVEFIEAMKAVALAYAAAMGWSSQVGLFFHVFGHNSVNSLHLHIVDLTEVGPGFEKLSYKNCPLDAVLEVLREELAVCQAAVAAPSSGVAASARAANKAPVEKDRRFNLLLVRLCLISCLLIAALAYWWRDSPLTSSSS